MSNPKEGYLCHKGYRANKEHGNWVWTRILPKKLVGKHPDSGKPIKIALSGDSNVASKRVVTNTSDYNEAIQMLNRFLKKDPKPKKHAKAPNQIDLLSAIREAEQ